MPTAEPCRLHLGPQGRLVIPAALRRALGLQPGDTLVAWAEGDRLVLQPRGAVEEELWSLCAAVGGQSGGRTAPRAAPGDTP